MFDDLEKVIVIKKFAEIIENVQNEFYYRLGYCQDVQRQRFEHLL
jgi:hypothetical protein